MPGSAGGKSRRLGIFQAQHLREQSLRHEINRRGGWALRPGSHVGATDRESARCGATSGSPKRGGTKTDYQQHLRHENHTVALRRRSPAEEPTPTPLIPRGSAGGKWSCPALREASRDD